MTLLIRTDCNRCIHWGSAGANCSQSRCHYTSSSDGCMNLVNVPLSRKETYANPPSPTKPTHKCASTFGESLFAGYRDSYAPDFVLQGTKDINHEELARDLQSSLKHSVLDEPVSDAVCIVANTDDWSCNVWTLSRKKDALRQTNSETLESRAVSPSELVSEIVDSAKELTSLQLPAHFCLLNMEEQLKDIYNRSVVWSEVLRNCVNNRSLASAQLSKQFGYHDSDIELLSAVASTHSMNSANSSSNPSPVSVSMMDQSAMSINTSNQSVTNVENPALFDQSAIVQPPPIPVR